MQFVDIRDFEAQVLTLIVLHANICPLDMCFSVILTKERVKMKSVEDLELGFSDAQNYAQRHNKELFNSIFVRNTYLDDLVKQSVFFLVGEKGTGKTAYATYLSNNSYNGNTATTVFLSSTDYEKFYALKQRNELGLTNYGGIWKVILLLLISKSIKENSKVVNAFTKSGIYDILDAIDEYYAHAFSPEIANVMKVIYESETVAKLIFKYVEGNGKSGQTLEYSETRFQQNLFYIEKNFCEALKSIKLKENVILFIDGIDVRPDTIAYSDYIQCIRGLADAAWYLNTALFQDLRDSKGRLRVVLLLRPDIFSSLNLQNSTAKLLDNSVFLDWRTTYRSYKTSRLYQIGIKLLSYNQPAIDCQDIWEEYLGWHLRSTSSERDYDTSFMAFLRISLSRPRDILVILQYLRNYMKANGMGKSSVFVQESFESDEFQNNYSEYFVGSLKDQMSFYYSSVDFEHFLKLFDYFDKTTFTYDEYKANYDLFIDYILNNAEEIPEFVDDPVKLLQLLYDCNIIMAITQKNDTTFFQMSYREKSNANINPKVPIGDNITYRFHYGMYKKAKLGRY